MRDIHLRSITPKERNTLHLLLDDDPESGYRAKIILLKDEGYTVSEIRKITNHHDNNIRKWIHRFNEKGVEGIISKIHTHKSIKFTDGIEKQRILEMKILTICCSFLYYYLQQLTSSESFLICLENR